MWQLLIGSLVVLLPATTARIDDIQDVDAFPKYAVTFLNSLPVANETAETWIRHGLVGGEQEFLQAAPTPSLERIEGSDAQSSSEDQAVPAEASGCNKSRL